MQLAPGVYAERGSGELGDLDDYGSYVGLCVDVQRYDEDHPGDTDAGESSMSTFAAPAEGQRAARALPTNGTSHPADCRAPEGLSASPLAGGPSVLAHIP